MYKVCESLKVYKSSNYILILNLTFNQMLNQIIKIIIINILQERSCLIKQNIQQPCSSLMANDCRKGKSSHAISVVASLGMHSTLVPKKHSLHGATSFAIFW